MKIEPSFKRALSTDKDRKALTLPGYRNGLFAATNGRVILAYEIDESNAPKEQIFASVPKQFPLVDDPVADLEPPNYRQVIPDLKQPSTPLIFDRHAVGELLEPFRPSYTVKVKISENNTKVYVSEHENGNPSVFFEHETNILLQGLINGQELGLNLRYLHTMLDFLGTNAALRFTALTDPVYGFVPFGSGLKIAVVMPTR